MGHAIVKLEDSSAGLAEEATPGPFTSALHQAEVGRALLYQVKVINGQNCSLMLRFSNCIFSISKDGLYCVPRIHCIQLYGTTVPGFSS